MKIAIGNDHGGYEMKYLVKDHLESKGYEVVNFGSDVPDSVNYPQYAKKVADAVASGECDFGVLICGTGIGMSIAANKVKGIRACACSDPFTARATRKHNNSNIITLGARVIGPELALMIIDEFFASEFEGARHQTRIDMITAIENGEDI